MLILGRVTGGEKWDVDTLTEVAVRFADLVAACPQRTHATLTKYTALRGYLEWNLANNVLHLDYELAQLYTAELLDVYMGYKVIWDLIHTMIQIPIPLDRWHISYLSSSDSSYPFRQLLSYLHFQLKSVLHLGRSLA